LTLAINGARASRVTVTTPWSGAWFADVEIPLELATSVPPAGPVVITVGTSSLVGTVDPNLAPSFAGVARLRVVGGAGGWERAVSAKSYHSDGGLLSTSVLATTAAEVGERLVEAVPFVIGTDYVRAAGPAARVLAGLDWYVDHTGVTQVAPRVPSPASPDVRLLSFDPRTTVAELATTTEILTPGMLVVDERAGTLKLRDVEQTFGAEGARVRAWCVSSTATPSSDGLPGSRLLAVMSAIAREACRADFLPARRYRVISQGGDGRLALQSVDPRAPLPTLRMIEIAHGVPGTSVKVVPGSIVHVRFLDGDPSRPVVVAFESSTPISIDFEAIGINAGGSQPLAIADQVVSALSAICAAGGVAAPAMTAALAPFLTTIPSKILRGA
jgi:hypothetical protein